MDDPPRPRSTTSDADTPAPVDRAGGRAGAGAVLAAVDGSGVTTVVVETGASLARLLGHELVVVRVDPAGPSRRDGMRVNGVDGTIADLRVVAGDPVRRILDLVGASGAELVVLAGRSRAGSTTVLGTVTAGVAERSAVPIVVVPPAVRSGGSAHPWRHLLFAADDGAHTTADDPGSIVRLAAAGLTVEVVHVDGRGEGHDHHPGDGHVAHGSAPTALLDVIRRRRTDLVAIRRPADWGAGRAATARVLVRSSPVPVLLAEPRTSLPARGQPA